MAKNDEIKKLKQEIKALRNKVKRLENDCFLKKDSFNDIPLGIIIHINGIIQYANKITLKAIKAKRKSDFIGKSIDRFIRPQDKEIIHERILNVIKTKKPANNVKEIFFDLNGNEIYAELSVLPIKYRGEDAILLFLKDITEQIKYEKMLKESEEKYKKLTENSLVGIYLIQDNKIIFCNKKYAEIIGEKRVKDVIGKSVFNYVYEEDIPIVEKEIKKRALNKKAYSHYVIRHKRGNEIRYHEIFGSKITLNNKPALSGVLIDITDRITTEKQLKISQETYKGIIDSIQEAIYVQDKDGIFLDVNKGALKMYGYKNKKELIGKTPLEVSAEGLNNMEDIYNKFIKTFTTGKSQEFEFWGKRKDGSIFPKNVRLYKGNYFNEDVVIAVAQDISEKKELEKQKEIMNLKLQRSQKLKSLGTLAGGIAHDFNNILTPILGYSDLIKKLNKDKKIDNLLNLIIESSKRAKELIMKILSYSKDLPKNKEYINIQKEIENILNFLEESIPSTIKIKKKISKISKPFYADPVQIQQLIMNLCTNSFKALENKGGILEIELKEVKKRELPKEIKYLEGKYFIKIKVEDNGTGMSKETLNNIFEPFYTTKAQGTGLGMFIVNNIVDSYKGEILINSEINRGTSIEIYLPLDTKFNIKKIEKKTSDKISSEINQKIKKAKNLNILVIDDEKAITELIYDTLTLENHKVKTFNKPLKAIKHLTKNKNKYDLIITDLTMPELTGTDFSKKLKELQIDTPIILLTGYNKKLNQDKLEEYNIKKILMKPISIETLINEVNLLVNN